MTNIRMCTVSVIPISENDFILTSNRDEAEGRKTLFPEFYQEQEVRLLYPKDAVAGGTWIGVSEKNTLVCLLNGGFEGHKRLPSYRQSRGVVVKDILIADDHKKCLLDYDCVDIEPFTLVVVNWTGRLSFFELVWDGVKKHVQELPLEPRIWSSSTLYTKEIKELRQQWFADFVATTSLGTTSILRFHKEGGIGDPDVDLVMDRGVRKTCSVTQVSRNDEMVTMRYEDLHKQEKSLTTFEAITV